MDLNEQMFGAVARLNIEEAISCINKGAELNALNKEGDTALTVLATASKFDYVPSGIENYLALVEDEEIKKKIIKMSDQLGEQAPLFLDHYILRVGDISQQERIKLMKKLIEAGADVNKTGKDSANPLYAAAVLSVEVETVKFLLENGADPMAVVYAGSDEETTVMNAAHFELQVQEMALRDFNINKTLLHDGKDFEMQQKEISDLRKIIAMMEESIKKSHN